MATILCLSDGMVSVVFPALELSRRLAADGHTVVFGSSPAHREAAERLDLSFLPLAHSELTAARRADDALGFFHRITGIDSRRQRLLSSLNLNRLAEYLGQNPVDLVLIDGEMHEQILVALGAVRRNPRLRVALLNSFSSIWRGPALPPPHTAVRPGVGWRGSRLAVSLYWWVSGRRKAYRRVRQWLRHLGCDRVSLLRALAEANGLDLSREVDRKQWLQPFTYRRLPFLSLHALEFEFPHRPPPHVRYVGPMILRSRPTVSTPQRDEVFDETERLERILSDSQPGEDVLYAAFGSTLTASRDFLRRLIAACDVDGWTLILSLGSTLDPSALGPLPTGVHVFRWLPQLQVLEKAAVAITHGGINTLDECVLQGVPVLVYCGQETDMAGNSARVVHHGIGLSADPREGSQEIRRRIRQLLDDRRAYRDRIATLREKYLAYERSAKLESTVRELLDPRLAAATDREQA